MCRLRGPTYLTKLFQAMKTLLLLTLSLVFFSSATTTLARRPKKMKAFASEGELQQYLKNVAATQRRAARKRFGVKGLALEERVKQ